MNALSHRRQHRDTRRAITARLGRPLAWIELHDLQHHIARQRRIERAIASAADVCSADCHGCRLTAKQETE